jgi:hypothetical protein
VGGITVFLLEAGLVKSLGAGSIVDRTSASV